MIAVCLAISWPRQTVPLLRIFWAAIRLHGIISERHINPVNHVCTKSWKPGDRSTIFFFTVPSIVFGSCGWNMFSVTAVGPRISRGLLSFGKFVDPCFRAICTAQWSLYVPHSGHYMYRIVVTICTTSLTFTFLRSAHTVYLCVLCGSENKQRLFPYTALTDWFV